jgi:hypothetical protein
LDRLKGEMRLDLRNETPAGRSAEFLERGSTSSSACDQAASP